MSQTLLRNASLLDLDAACTRPGLSVLIEDERIVDVKEGEIHASGAHSIDVGGRTLMPGLIDAHVHCTITTMNFASMARRPPNLIALQAAKILAGMLRRGFTTVRDAGGAEAGLAQAVEQGLIAGPRIFYSGRTLSQTGGHGDVVPRLQRTPDPLPRLELAKKSVFDMTFEDIKLINYQPQPFIKFEIAV